MSEATQPEANRRRGRPGYDQGAVLRQAIELFIDRGYDATSIADIASSLGITKSAVFHHVSSKEALLEAALDEALDGLTRAIDSAATSQGNATERLRATVTESVLILTEHLPAVTLLLRVRGNSEVEERALARRRRIDEQFAQLVRDAMAEGSLRDDVSPELIARLLFGTVNSLTEWYAPDGPLAADVLAATVTSIVFEGLDR